MRGVCLAMNQEFVLVWVMIEENLFAGRKMKGRMKTAQIFLLSSLIAVMIRGCVSSNAEITLWGKRFSRSMISARRRFYSQSA